LGVSPAEIDQRNEGEHVGFLDAVLAETTTPLVYMSMQADNLHRLITNQPIDPVTLSFSQVRKAMYDRMGETTLLQKVGMAFSTIASATMGTFAPLVGGLAELLNKSAVGLVNGLEWGVYNAYAQVINLKANVLRKAGLISKEDFEREMEVVRTLEAESDQNFQKKWKIYDNANYGLIGTLVLMADTNFGWGLFNRKVKYVDQNGNVGETTVNAWAMQEELEDLKSKGYNILEVEDKPKSTERWATVITTVADVFDPVSNHGFGLALKGFRPINRTVLNSTAWALNKTGMPRWLAETAVGKSAVSFANKMEAQLGVALTATNRVFTKAFAPLNRLFNSRVELTKRVLDGTENYLLTGKGLVADLIQNGKAETLLGKDAVQNLLDTRLEFQRRIDKLVNEEGMPVEEAQKKVLEDFRRTQAFALWAQTGIPYSPEIIEQLSKKGLTADEAKKIIEQAGHRLNETEANALNMLLITGNAKYLKDLSPAFSEMANKDWLENALRMLRLNTYDNFVTAQRILEDTEVTNMEELTQKYGVFIDRYAMDVVDSLLPHYKKAHRMRYVTALSLLNKTTDPNERQAIADLVALHMAQNGVSLNRLSKILRRVYPEITEDNPFGYILTAVDDLLEKQIKGEDATNLLNAFKQASEEVTATPNVFENLRRMVEKAKDLGIGDNVITALKCGSGYVFTTLPALLDDTNGAGRTHMVSGGLDLIHEENALRSVIQKELHAKGIELSQIPDREFADWLSGNTQFTRIPYTETEADALRFIFEEAENAGISPEYLSKSVQLQRSLMKAVTNIVDTAGVPIPREELTKALRLPSDAKQVLEMLVRRMTELGRIEDAYRLEHVYNEANTLHAFMSNVFDKESEVLPNNQIMQEFMKPMTLLYYLGKDYALREGRDVLLRNLQQFSHKIAGDTSFISDEPTLIHTVRLNSKEHGVASGLEGKFTTPYVAKVLQGLVDEPTVWRGWLSFLNTIMKMSAVVWQPLALVRDFVSNTGALIHGMNLEPQQAFKVGLYYRKAIQAINTHNEDFLRVAEQTPSVWGATIEATALQNERFAKTQSGRITEKILWKLSNLPILRNLQYMRGYSEAMGKMAMYYAVEDLLKNATKEDLYKLADDFGIDRRIVDMNANDLSVLVAEKYMIDYHDVVPAVQFLRRYLGLFPFITYETKMMSNLLGDFISGRRLTSLGFMLKTIRSAQRAVDALSMGQETETISPETYDPLNEDEVTMYHKAIRSMLPERLKADPFTIAWKSPDTGRVNVISLSYYLPYGVLLPFQRLAISRDKYEQVKNEIRQRTGGFIVPMFEVLINRDLFTGKEIYDPNDPVDKKQIKTLLHLLNTVMPLLPVGLQNAIMEKNLLSLMPSEEDFRKTITVLPADKDPFALFFGVYQIQPNRFQNEYKRRMRMANTLLNKAQTEYSRLIQLGKPIEAENVYKHYLREANRVRTEAYEMLSGGWTLQGETPFYFNDPAVGYNPMNSYGIEIRLLQELYDTLRQNNELPQRTSKEEIMWFLTDVAESVVRTMIGFLGYMRYAEPAIGGVAEANRDQYRKYRQSQREAKTALPLPPPLLHEYTPDDPTPFAFTPETTNDNGNIQLPTSYMDNNRPKAVAMRELAKMVANQQINQPPSLGADLGSNAGRPNTGGVA